MTRRNLFLLALVGAILIALAGFYLYLAGGADGGSEDSTATASSKGLVHVRSVYVADGENLRRPTGLGVAENGDFFVTLKEDARVIGFDRSGDFLVKWGEQGIGQGQLMAPISVAADNASNQVYVIDRSRLRIICFDTAGQFQWEQPLLNPVGIALRDDDLLVSTFGPIVRLTREGERIAEYGARSYAPGNFDYARSLLPVEADDVIVADTNNARVQRVTISDEETAPVAWITGEPPTRQDDPNTLFGVPSGITADSEGNVYVLDGFRHKIDVLNPKTGKIIHTFEGLDGKGDGQFELPTGIGYLGDDTFAITDTYNDRIQIVRLLLPGEDTFVNRYRWLAFLPALLLLPLLLLFRRRRTFVTREALEAAASEGRLRLLAGAFRKLHVTPETEAAFHDREESGVRIGAYLVTAGVAGDEAEESRLARAATPTRMQRVLLARHTVICGDLEQCARVATGMRVSVRDWTSVLEEFRMEGDAESPDHPQKA